jgi:hypothetical protein
MACGAEDMELAGVFALALPYGSCGRYGGPLKYQ